MPTYLSGAAGLRVVMCFASAYLLSYAFRSVNAVIAPALLAELKLSNADLGLLSSAYFVAFASLQLPLGIWLDRYGARRTEAALLMFAAAGAVIFATSHSLTGLWIGRAMIGVGVSSCLMAPFKAYRQWYAPQRQSQLASWMLVAGTAGALLTTVPVSMAMPVIGWRGVFWIMAGLILLAASAIFFLLKDIEARVAADASAEAAKAGAGMPAAPAVSYREIFGNPYFRRLTVIGAANQASFLALQTLWAGPWMITVLGMSRTQTAEVLFAFNFSLLLAYMALSWWAPRYVATDSKGGWPLTTVVGIGLGGTIAIQVLMLMTTSQWSWMLWIALAIFTTVMTLAQTQVSLSFPPSMVGRANSAYNVTVFTSAFFLQWGIGIVIDIFESMGASPATAMRCAFGLCVALQAAALLAFVMSRAESARPAELA